MEIATIKVMYKPGKYEMIINESDFDEKVHEKIAEKKVNNKPEKKAEKISEDDVKSLMGEE